jgi:hypothetical protein
MKPRSLSAALRFAAIAVCCCLAAVESAAAQNTASSTTHEVKVVLTKLSPPIYPPLARQAVIHGDVEIYLGLGKDGSVASVELFKGHAMLAPAALESARNSLFECRGCSDSITSYVLTFAFELRKDGDCCNAWSRAAEVKESEGRITVSAPYGCICDPVSISTRTRVRSAKCLYIWKCGLR